MKYLYKCKLCGKTYVAKQEDNVDRVIQRLTDTIFKMNGVYRTAGTIPIYKTHGCDGFMTGVAEFIGICDDQEAEEE